MAAQVDDEVPIKRGTDHFRLTPRDLAAITLGGGGVDFPLYLCTGVASYRQTTPQNINLDGITFAWDDAINRREDPGISINAASEVVTIAGQPDSVRIDVNIPVSIADNVNIQRPAQIFDIVRSDGAIITGAATGYIRDPTDHETASYNISVKDAQPILNGGYRIDINRETTRAGVVNSDVVRSLMTIEVFQRFLLE